MNIASWLPLAAGGEFTQLSLRLFLHVFTVLSDRLSLVSVEGFPAGESADEVERPHGLVVRHHVAGVPHQHHRQVAHVLGVASQLVGHVPLGTAALLPRRTAGPINRKSIQGVPSAWLG